MRNCRSILLLLVGCLFVLEGWGQLNITQANTVYKIDFDNAVAGVNVDTFKGSGFTPTPGAGQLDSDAWRVYLSSTENFNFGDTRETVPSFFARTNSSGGVTDGGIWAFEVNSNNYALGIQPSGAAFTPGHIVLKIQNNTGCVVTSIDVDYMVYILNDQDRANSFNFSYSDDDLNYTNVTALNLVSPEPMDNPASWVVNSKSTTLTGLEIAPGSSFYLRWTGADAGGGGSRDEFALDDIEINVFSDRDVTNLGTSLSCNDRAFVSWDNPVSGTCWNEVLIIASTSGAITAVPTGNGLAYSANDTFGSGTEIAPGEFVVFKGTEEDFVLYGLATDSTYHLKAFTRNGTNWVSGDSHQFDVGENCFQSVQTGIWSSNSSWEQFDGSQWVLNAGYPNATWQNTLVRSNHWIEINTSPMSCGNLSIEANGRVYNVGQSPLYLNIGGDLECNGVFGSDDGLSMNWLGINFNYSSHEIKGTGLFDAYRIRKNENSNITTLLTISRDVFLRWHGLPLYSNCPNCEFNIIVQPEVTVSLPGNSGGQGVLTLSLISTSSFGKLDIFGTVETGVFRPYNRIQSAQSEYVVHSGGKLLVNGEVSLSDSTSPVRDSVIILSDGEIEFVKAGQVFSNPFNDVDPLSKWVLNAASTTIYYSASSQIVESDLQYGHLNLEGSGIKTLNGNTLVRGNMSIGIGSELDVSTSNYDITLWGDWDNQNQPPDSGFVPRSAKVFLKGTFNQSILSGPGQVFNRLVLDNPAGASLLARADITDSLILTSGKLDIGIHDLGVRQAVIAGNFGPNTFIKADDLGYVVANVTTGHMLLPLGRNPYLPLSLSCAGCGPIEVNIRLKQGHDLNPVLNPGDTFNTNVVNAQWEIFAIDTVPNLTIEVGWPVSEQLPGFSPSETFIRHWESGSSTYWTNQLPAAPATGLGPFSRSWSIMSLPGGTHFFGVGGNPLLLSNSSFTLTAKPGLAGILLHWEAAEQPEAGSTWIVERQTGHGLWEAINEIPVSHINQEWVDTRPSFGQNYYRIAILGPDGSRAWSNIAMARWDRQGIWHIGPNPASTHINITASHLGEGVLQLELYHTSGTRVLAMQAGTGPDMQEQLPLSSLAPGLYVLVVSRGSEPILRERIVIQR